MSTRRTVQLFSLIVTVCFVLSILSSGSVIAADINAQKKACSTGDKKSCDELYLNSTLATANYYDQSLVNYYFQVCNTNKVARACSWAAGGSEKNQPDKAFAYAEMACNQGDGLGCAFFANLNERKIGKESKPDRAGELYKTARTILHQECADSLKYSCVFLWGLYIGKKVAVNISTMRTLSEKLCNDNVMGACEYLGDLYRAGTTDIS